MRLPDRGEACIAVGVLGQLHGQHLPLSISAMLIAGGLGWAVSERYWEFQRKERLAEYDHSLLNPHEMDLRS